MMVYFNDTMDLKEAKAHYRALAKRLHPDRGGNAADFQDMQREYTRLLQGYSKEADNDKYSTDEQKTILMEEIIKELKAMGLSDEFIKILMKHMPNMMGVISDFMGSAPASSPINKLGGFLKEFL